MHYKTAIANSSEFRERRKNLRNNSTPAEAVLWRSLKGRGAGGYKFRRQQSIGPYILDFYCPELRLCIELDGSSHDLKFDFDQRRSGFLHEQGIRVVRFENNLVRADVDGIVAEIIRIGEEIKEKELFMIQTIQTPPLPLPLKGGEWLRIAMNHHWMRRDEPLFSGCNRRWHGI